MILMASVIGKLYKQRRFKQLLVSLLLFSLLLGVVVVFIERQARGATITSLFDGIWWSVTTITSVGYGDMYPVTVMGKMIGMVLEVVGVLAFGLLVGLVTVALGERKERFYWQRLFERLDVLETRMEEIEKKEDYLVKNGNDESEVDRVER